MLPGAAGAGKASRTEREGQLCDRSEPNESSVPLVSARQRCGHDRGGDGAGPAGGVPRAPLGRAGRRGARGGAARVQGRLGLVSLWAAHLPPPRDPASAHGEPPARDPNLRDRGWAGPRPLRALQPAGAGGLRRADRRADAGRRGGGRAAPRDDDRRGRADPGPREEAARGGRARPEVRPVGRRAGGSARVPPRARPLREDRRGHGPARLCGRAPEQEGRLPRRDEPEDLAPAVGRDPGGVGGRQEPAHGGHGRAHAARGRRVLLADHAAVALLHGEGEARPQAPDQRRAGRWGGSGLLHTLAPNPKKNSRSRRR